MNKEIKFTWISKHPKASVIIVLVLLLLIILSSGEGSSNKNTNSVKKAETEIAQKDFSTLMKARFDEILKDSPDLESITCEGNCESVAYFNYKTIPNDLEMVIRSNTATYSNFKLKEKGVSHVSIFARYNGQTILQCDGSQGAVDSCK